MGTDDPLYGIGAERIACLTGVHISTARRWKRTRKHPRWVGPFLALALEGELDALGWRGWIIRADRLISPEGWTATPGEIRSIRLLEAQVRAYQRLQRSVQQADWIEERYVKAETDTA